jgi:hypothetical protein
MPAISAQNVPIVKMLICSLGNLEQSVRLLTTRVLARIAVAPLILRRIRTSCKNNV